MVFVLDHVTDTDETILHHTVMETCSVDVAMASNKGRLETSVRCFCWLTCALDCKRSKRACRESSIVFGEMRVAVAMRSMKNYRNIYIFDDVNHGLKRRRRSARSVPGEFGKFFCWEPASAACQGSCGCL